MGNCLSFQLSCDQTFNYMCGCLFGDGNYIHMMEANLETLEENIAKLEEQRDDLLRRVLIEEDNGLQRLTQVQGWFSRVERARSQVNDLLRDRSTQTQRLCMLGYCSNKCISSYNYGKNVSKCLRDVTALIPKEVVEVVAQKIRVPKVEKKHTQATTGLDSMVEKAWNSLMNDKRRSLGIYGMGGVGKTTLLSRINNKFAEVKNEFDVVIWVVVSKDLQNEGIQNQILSRLRLDNKREQETEMEKASHLNTILSTKKFVLLLDDLWSEVDLDNIGVPTPTPTSGSKIVFTTRSREVCKYMKADDEMKVDCLSEEEAWELFRNIVGEIPLRAHQDIPKLAKKLAEKCCGLPLALCVIGKAMACKETIQEWRHAIGILNSSSHRFPGMEQKILSILKFSYDGLEDENAKLCFVYCSLFPEDYEIEKEELIEYWICEGFINGNSDKDADTNQGHDIIGSLVRAHLLMDGAFTARVKMHDMVREMALSIESNSGVHCVKSGVKLRQIPEDIKWESVRRISLMKNQIEKISRIPNSPNLSTFLLRNNKLVGISGEFFRFMQALVVLDLSNNDGLCGLPEEISSLSSLQYLNLSSTGIKLLPIGLKGLRNLIHLDLEYTHELQSIAGISKSLPKLQVLKFFYSHVCIDVTLMEELQLLEHLKILTVTIKDAAILERIQGVYRLASTVRALYLSHISAPIVILNTVALGCLQRLLIMFSEISEIRIDCSSSPGFRNLSTVEIFNLKGPKDLTWLLFAQNLKFLVVVLSSSIEEIISREKGEAISNVHPDIVAPFERLEFLKLSNLDELKSICWTPPALPRMAKFVLELCPNLPAAAVKFP
ncbi:unnamed protein product [Arabidopsis halleri]